MRVIKFRGKRIYNNKWIYGYLLKWGDLYAISSANYVYPVIIHKETVGQYTGLKDKNGKEIYEGDIVKCFSSFGCLHEIIWMVEVPNCNLGGMPGFYLSELSDGYSWTEKEELIGNIHDNPELLK